MATNAFAQIGSAASDLVFTPVTPCRIMDTRNPGSNSGMLLAGTTRTFYGISSASNYPSQGGSSPNCNIPFITDVAALVLNFTVVTPDTGGFITVFPADATMPTAATVNFTAGAVVGNNATLKVSQTTGNQFKIYTTSNLHVVGDVVGYYSKPVATALECQDTTAATAAINLVSGSQFVNYAFAAACPTGFTSVAIRCGVNSNVAAAFEYSAASEGYCGAHSPTNTETLSARRTCCRIPGR